MQIITTKQLPLSANITSFKHDGPTLGIRYCPSMDLLATFPQFRPRNKQDQEPYLEDNPDPYADNEAQNPTVEVYRLNGQKVFGITIESDKSKVSISDVAWRSDGVIVAILSSDNFVWLVNSFSGKIVHKFSSITKQHLTTVSPIHTVQTKSPSAKRSSTGRGGPPKKRRCLSSALSYTTHFLDLTATQTRLSLANEESGLVLDDLLALNADLGKLLKAKANLPKSLAEIDVEVFLPKLSTIPGSGFGDDDVFSTRTALDAMFHTTKSGMRSDGIDVLVAGHDDGILHMRVFDSFEVGDVDINRASHMPPGLTLESVSHITGHPLWREIFMIAQEAGNGPTASHTRSHGEADGEGHGLHLLRLDLRFIQHSNYNLPALATKSTQLHNVIRYLRQIETQLSREAKSAFDLPGRFIRNLNEDLIEQDGEGSNFATAAHHAIVTGEVHGKMKEWLVEQVSDRGVKRWEKAVGDCLDLTRRLISENWNPAVERAGVVLSRLSGLAASNAALGIDKKVINSLRDTIDVMGVIGEDVVRDVSEEIVGFSAFIKWFKWEVEAAALEDTSERLDEMREGSDHANVRKVLDYIAKGLSETCVKKYLMDTAPESDSATENTDDVAFYQKFKDLRGKNGKSQRIPSLASLLKRLSSRCEKLFEQVAETLKKNVLVDYILKLPSQMDDSIADARIVSVQDENEQGKTMRDFKLVVTGKHRDKPGSLSCTVVKMESTQSSQFETFEQAIEDTKAILDVKFAGNDELVILASTADTVKIYGADPMNFTKWSTRHVFHVHDGGFIDSGMKPAKLQVNGRKGRRALAVLDQRGRGYGVFDLDTSPADDGVDENDQIMTG